ncbi:MAG: hypothetical protein HYX43_13140 [Burkholderiales bacterium]|nr:hypothetical protein [Burkholderiales bacterium]
MTPLRTTVQSFDLFDTLIARACVTPANLLAQVETALGATGFASARSAAEQHVFGAGHPFGLEAIYRELSASGFCDPDTAARLMAAEIEAEFDNAIPITENIAAVRDFDLVVSDMYLPAATLRGLLQHVGLRRFVHLFVSNAGKHHGTIWPELAQRWLILRHVGDNPHADIAQAQRYAIPTVHYTGANPNGTEQYLAGNGLTRISQLIRQLRLANPFLPMTVEAELWNHFVQYNFPLLCLTAHSARAQRDAAGLERLLFLARDCHFLSEIFLTLYPGEPFELVQVSRSALGADPQGMLRYLLANGLQHALVCDLVSTGYSWLQFSQDTQQPLRFFTLIHIDNYQYRAFDSTRLHQPGPFQFAYGVRSSEVNAWSLAIELLNTAPHGSTLGMHAVGSGFAPQFEDRHELPPSLLKTLLLAQAAAIQCLRPSRAAVAQELDAVPNPQHLLSTLVSALSGTDWLNRFASAAICHPMN